MKHYSTLLFFLFLGFSNLYAQIGITGSYKNIDTKNWDHLLDNDSKLTDVEYYLNGASIGVDYWFRLKNYRVEFHPEINATYSLRNGDNVQHAVFQSADALITGLEIHTNFYFLDFLGDCDCPTFSKDNEVFKKGFFFQLSPGMTYNMLSNAISSIPGDDESPEINHSVSTANFKFSAGIGIDFGLNKFVTITPMVRYGRIFNINWDNLSEQLNAFAIDDLDQSNWDEITAALRLGIRFDGRKY